VAVATSGTQVEFNLYWTAISDVTCSLPPPPTTNDEITAANNGLVFRPVPSCKISTQVDCSKEQAVSSWRMRTGLFPSAKLESGGIMVFLRLQRKPDGSKLKVKSSDTPEEALNIN
jgi:hypothetical protein